MKIIQEALFDSKEIKNKEIKKNMEAFDEILENILSSNNEMNIDIIIDQMPKENIDILIEHITDELIRKTDIIQTVIYNKDTKSNKLRDTLIIINDMDIFEDEVLDGYRCEYATKKFFEENRKNNNIVILSSPGKVENSFRKISNEIFDCDTCIHLKGLTTKKEMYEELIKKYEKKNIEYKLSYKSFLKILENLEKLNEYPVDYIYNYSVKKLIVENKKIVTIKTFENLLPIEKVTQSIKAENLNNLIGLDNIKTQLNTLYNYMEFCKKIKNTDIYLNLFFLGNPGTGKTTVARIYKDKLYKLGYIKENKIIEITPNDLTGEYVGHTKKKARRVLDEAEGGLLFIDEAYQLYSDKYSKGNNPYMEEAIVELLKYLENPKNIVIFAGYTEEMKKIYDINPGIKSRIYGEIMFNDYNEKELYQILESNLNKRGITINKNSKTRIENYIKIIKEQKNFGNARTMKQLSQTLIMNHANKSKTLIVDATDLPEIKIKNTRMGFDKYGR